MTLNKIEASYYDDLEKHESEQLLQEALKTSHAQYSYDVRATLVKQRIGIWARAACRAIPGGSRIVPRDAVMTILSFVGDGFNMNPMTGNLATVLRRVDTSWDRVCNKVLQQWQVAHQKKLIENMLNEVSSWWQKNGGELVAQTFQKVPKAGGVKMDIDETIFPNVFKLVQSLSYKNHLGEESNIVTRLRQLFCQSPYRFEGVLADPYTIDRKTSREVAAHMYSTKRLTLTLVWK